MIFSLEAFLIAPPLPGALVGGRQESLPCVAVVSPCPRGATYVLPTRVLLVGRGAVSRRAPLSLAIGPRSFPLPCVLVPSLAAGIGAGERLADPQVQRPWLSG